MPSQSLFPMRAELRLAESYTGEVEPILGEPMEIRCLIAHEVQARETAETRVEVGQLKAYCDPSTPIVPTGSRLTYQGSEYTVMRAAQWRFPGRTYLETVELTLR